MRLDGDFDSFVYRIAHSGPGFDNPGGINVVSWNSGQVTFGQSPAKVLGQEGKRALADILEARPVTRFRIPVNERQADALSCVRKHGTINLSTYRAICPYWSDEINIIGNNKQTGF
jgi:hypothetical protein